MPGATKGPVPIVRMFGVNMEGNSILAHVHGFAPYFYVQAVKDFKQEDCGHFRDALNEAVVKDMRSNKDNIVDAVLAVELCSKESEYNLKSTKVCSIICTIPIPE